MSNFFKKYSHQHDIVIKITVPSETTEISYLAAQILVFGSKSYVTKPQKEVMGGHTLD